jgi:hypothetical protein
VNEIWAVGGAGNDKITMPDDMAISATLDGQEGNDSLKSGDGADYVLGGAGNDVIHGRGGADHISGDGGNDFIEGDAGGDSITGDAGNDSIIGNAGNDSLEGGDGKDVIVSVGGGQHDSVRGGAGADIFWVDSESSEKVYNASSADTTHRIAKFKDLTVHHGIMNDDVQAVSRNLGGQSLIDPIADTSYQDWSDHPLFNAGGAVQDDVHQSDDVHDCYFLAALAAVAKLHPHVIERNVVDFGDGTYGVCFRGVFGKEFIRVDGDLPTKTNGTLHYAQSENGALWVSIMEKAWTFFRHDEGMYDSIAWGPTTETFNALGLTDNQSFGPFLSDKQTLMNRIKSELNAGRAVVGLTNPDADAHVDALADRHWYHVDHLELDGDGNVTNVVFFNPYNTWRTISARDVFENFKSFTVASV